MMFWKILLREQFGGEGSGNFGHAGRPGEVGGSGAGGYSNKEMNTRTFIHESDYDFDKFDKSKIGSGQGQHWFGKGIYFQQQGSFKIEQYGGIRYETTLREDARLFTGNPIEYAKDKGILTREMQNKLATFASKDEMPRGWSIGKDSQGKYFAFDENNRAVTARPSNTIQEVLKVAYNKKNGISELGNITPKDLFDQTGIEEHLKKDGFDGFYNDGELVVYNPSVLTIKRKTHPARPGN